jgi:hypothetical protein
MQRYYIIEVLSRGWLHRVLDPLQRTPLSQEQLRLIFAPYEDYEAWRDSREGRCFVRQITREHEESSARERQQEADDMQADREALQELQESNPDEAAIYGWGDEGEDDDDIPSEDNEEYLTCASCGLRVAAWRELNTGERVRTGYCVNCGEQIRVYIWRNGAWFNPHRSTRHDPR